MCDDCQAYRQNPDYRLFTPRCQFCGGRLIYLIGRLPRPKEERSQRMKQVLADWMEWGHEEKVIRELAKWAAVEPERKKR